MVILLKIKRTDFFQRDSIRILVSRTVKIRKFKLLGIFEMKHVKEMEPCTKIYFLFIFNLVYINHLTLEGGGGGGGWVIF